MERLNVSSRVERLRRALRHGGTTQLGVGPMSLASVDATIELANRHACPLMLIASRRQVECREQGGGYVNDWCTEDFAEYARVRDPGDFVLLCRDHGGPWQSTREKERAFSVPEAMASAKQSLEADLRAGFDILHLDPSVPPSSGKLPRATVLELLFELFDFVMETADHLGRRVLVEVGTEEQDGGQNSPEALAEFLEPLSAFVDRRGYELPLFVVAQTGTLVRETRNVGALAGDAAEEQGRLDERIRRLVEVARRYGVAIKEHNGDYLSEAILAKRPGLGIGATNIAPEYGVAETRFVLSRCEALGLNAEAEAFRALALASNKWQKWMLPNTTATDGDRAEVAGHYVFAKPAFVAVLAALREAHATRGLDFDKMLRDAVRDAIVRTARPLGLLIDIPGERRD